MERETLYACENFGLLNTTQSTQAIALFKDLNTAMLAAVLRARNDPRRFTNVYVVDTIWTPEFEHARICSASVFTAEGIPKPFDENDPLADPEAIKSYALRALPETVIGLTAKELDDLCCWHIGSSSNAHFYEKLQLCGRIQGPLLN